MSETQPNVYVYVDETGDRGASPSSSPIFGMSAIVLDKAGAAATRAAVAQLRSDFGVPNNKVMSWKEHVKNHDRRRRAAEVLGSIEHLKVCFVYALKSELQAGSYRDDPQRFYDYVALKTYKATLWAARNWKGSNARVWTRFGHVRGHDHTATKRYLLRSTTEDARVPSHLEQGLRWVSADTYTESQAADIFGGFLKSALWPSGEYGYVEPSYLLAIWSKIRNSESCAIPLGLMSMPENSLVTQNAWFPCPTCPQVASAKLQESRQPLKSFQGPIH